MKYYHGQLSALHVCCSKFAGQTEALSPHWGIKGSLVENCTDQPVITTNKSAGCAWLYFANVNLFCFSSLLGLSRRFAFHTFSGMLASGKLLSNGKNNKYTIQYMKYPMYVFVSSSLLCLP